MTVFIHEVQTNLFIYYGIIVTVGDVTRVTNGDASSERIYGLVYGHGLDFKRLGHAEAGVELVVGRELYAKPRFAGLTFSYDRNGLVRMTDRGGARPDIRLTTAEETDVTTRLYKIGLVRAPSYLIVTNYVTNDVRTMTRG